MKPIAGLLLIVLIFFAAMNLIGKKDTLTFEGVKNASLIKTSAETYALKGELGFFNPSSFSSQLGSVNVEIYVERQFAGHIEYDFSHAIKSKSTLALPFEIRFTNEEVVLTDNTTTIEVRGSASPNTMLFNYTITVNDTLNISEFSE